MVLKIINAILILFAVFMGFKQGSAMFAGKPEMLELFGKWHIGKSGVMVNGLVTMLSAVLILFQRLCMGKFSNGCRDIAYYLFSDFRKRF